MISTAQKAIMKMRLHGLKRTVPHTQLTSYERRNAEDVWAMQLGTRPTLDSPVVLFQLLERLQMPMQPVIRAVVDATYADNSHNFTFDAFVSVLEMCKTLHARWLHKIRGKKIDDDVLEAFIAVGGEADSTGAVDVAALSKMLHEFNLSMPDLPQPASPSSPTKLQQEVAPQSMAFTGFVDLLRTDGPHSQLSAQLFLRDRDLDDDGDGSHVDSAPQSRNCSRRQSMAKSGYSRLPPLHQTNGGRQQAEQQGGDVNAQPKRSKTSMSDPIPAASNKSGQSTSPLRHSSSKATGVSRLPQINRQKREKKHKFANW